MVQVSEIRSRPRGRILDTVEQVVATGLYIWLVMRLWPTDWSAAGWYSLLIVFSEGIIIVLLLARRPTDMISTDLRDWAIAAGGTFLSLLITKGAEPLAPALGGFLMLAGIATHLGAKFSLRRSFGLVAAHRGLKVSGLYRVVRHPMYIGYILTHVGFLFVAPNLWNLGVYLAVWSLLVARIFAEERILGQDPEYREFMTRVRYRLVPGVF